MAADFRNILVRTDLYNRMNSLTWVNCIQFISFNFELDQHRYTENWSRTNFSLANEEAVSNVCVIGRIGTDQLTSFFCTF